MILSPITYYLGHSSKQSLRLTTVHREDLKTFEGNWTIALSRTPRLSYPPITRKTLKRGSYIDIKEHIMH
jgi:hypothetical protein